MLSGTLAGVPALLGIRILIVTVLCTVSGGKVVKSTYVGQRAGPKCVGDASAPVHLPSSCFSSQEVTVFRDDLLEMLEDNPDVQLLFFYLNIEVDGEVFYPGLCCWNHDESADGNTPLAWALWRDSSGKAYLDMSLQHIDMWMLPLVTMQRNVHVVSNLTLTVNGACWRKRNSLQRLRDLTNLLRVIMHAVDGDREESGLCWREQIATFDPLFTLLWGALSPWGAIVVQYHIVSSDGSDVVLEPLWTIQWLTVMLHCMLYLLALFIPLPILSAWQRVHDQAVADAMQVCLSKRQPTADCLVELALGRTCIDKLKFDDATHAKVRSVLDPHSLLPSTSLVSWKRLQSTRLWFGFIFAAVLLWQLVCVWWTSRPGSVDLCERCRPAAKHKVLVAALLLVGVYVWKHLPEPSLVTRKLQSRLDSKQPSDKCTHDQATGKRGDRVQYRITLRTLSLTATTLDSVMDCDTDLGVEQHGAQFFIGALYDALQLSMAVFTSTRTAQTPDTPPPTWSFFSRCRHALSMLLAPCWVCVRVIGHLLTVVRVSPLFLLVSMFLQRNRHVSFARHYQAGTLWRWLYKGINIAVFVLMWGFVVLLLHDLFHVLAYAVIGLVINAKLFVPWLVLLLSLAYQVKVAHQDLHQPFVATKATVLEEYIKDTPLESLCSRVVEHTYTVLALRLVHTTSGAFDDCHWEARALHSAAQRQGADPARQLHAIYRARRVKVLAKWLLFACAVQLLLLLLSSVYGFETLPTYMQLLAGVAPLGLTWMVSHSNHNPQLMMRLLQASHVRSAMKDIAWEQVCSCMGHSQQVHLSNHHIKEE